MHIKRLVDRLFALDGGRRAAHLASSWPFTRIVVVVFDFILTHATVVVCARTRSCIVCCFCIFYYVFVVVILCCPAFVANRQRARLSSSDSHNIPFRLVRSVGPATESTSTVRLSVWITAFQLPHLRCACELTFQI